MQFGVKNVGRALLPVVIEDGQECPSYEKGRIYRLFAPLQGWFHAPCSLRDLDQLQSHVTELALEVCRMTIRRIRGRYDNRPPWIARGPMATLVLFSAFTGLCFSLASSLGMQCQLGQIPKSLHYVTTISLVIVYFCYLLPVSIFRPTVIWKRYPGHRVIMGAICALPMLIIVLLCIVTVIGGRP